MSHLEKKIWEIVGDNPTITSENVDRIEKGIVDYLKGLIAIRQLPSYWDNTEVSVKIEGKKAFIEFNFPEKERKKSLK